MQRVRQTLSHTKPPSRPFTFAQRCATIQVWVLFDDIRTQQSESRCFACVASIFTTQLKSIWVFSVSSNRYWRPTDWGTPANAHTPVTCASVHFDKRARWPFTCEHMEIHGVHKPRKTMMKILKLKTEKQMRKLVFTVDFRKISPHQRMWSMRTRWI